jgi:5-methylcytosine-specific restriction endonuclease McrA
MDKVQNFWWAKGLPHPTKGKHTSYFGKHRNLSNRKGRILNCPWCGKEFHADKPTEEYCSMQCSIDSGYRGRRISKAKGDKTGWVTPKNLLIRKSAEYKAWRKAVFERDGYTCVQCGDKSRRGHSVILHADRIRPFAYYPELRFNLSNGRTLCVECHKKTETYSMNRYRDGVGRFTTEERYLGAHI